MVDLQTLYDEHPINAAEVLSKLSEAGKDIDGLVPEDLVEFDQDHYGGVEATNTLAQECQITEKSSVLDICSGLGGSARYLAHQYRCRVVGLDLIRSRTEGGAELTRRVGLEGLVTHVCGSATEMEFDSDNFDAAISQEAFLHISEKDVLFANCFRVLKAGGRLAFTDWAAFEGLTDTARETLKQTIVANSLLTFDQYRAFVEGAGFKFLRLDDLSSVWREILKQRLEMYRSLKDETERRFGEKRHRKYIEAYEFFVDTINQGDLGGVRIVAEK